MTYLLFLKRSGERTEAPYNQPSTIPDNWNWQSLLKKDGDVLIEHCRLPPESLDNEKRLLGLMFYKS